MCLFGQSVSHFLTSSRITNFREKKNLFTSFVAVILMIDLSKEWSQHHIEEKNDDDVFEYTRS